MVLTTKEIILLIVIAALIFGVIASVIRKGFAVLLSIWAIFVIASLGFFWLPEKVGQWSNGETTITDTVNGVLSGEENASMDNAIEQGREYVSDNYQSWGEAVSSLWKKVTGGFSDYPTTEDVVKSLPTHNIAD